MNRWHQLKYCSKRHVVWTTNFVICCYQCKMFNGFARITQGAFDRTQPTRFRAFSIGIGALSIGESIYVTNSEMFGIIFPIRTLFIVLHIYGIGILLVYGVTGKLLSLDEILKKKIRSREMNNTLATS
jgi:hypothetical protein